MSFFAKNGINIVEEDRSRLILESWDSKELLNCLLDNIKKNNCELKINQDVKNIILLEDWNYEVSIEWWKKYISKNVIVSSWWKSFSHIWTTWEWYNIAASLW
jgi:predicted flavoprotein YhiN